MDNLLLVWEEEDGGAVLLGVYGDAPVLILPEEIEGRPLTKIGRYCFAPQGKESPSARRTFLGNPSRIDSSHRIGGSFLKEITLPQTVHVLDNAAFYNCRELERLSIGAESLAVGSDLFTNCWELRELTVRGNASAASSLKKILAVISSDLTVSFCTDGAVQARLFYPEYFESMDENTPAHIFNYSISGQGYRYRQCFAAGTAVGYDDYDKVFPVALPGETAETLCRIAMDRLVFPVSLSAEAEEQYRDYLTEQQQKLAALLCAGRDGESMACLAGKKLLTRETLLLLADMAAEKEWNEGAVLARELVHKHFGTKKKRYEF